MNLFLLNISCLLVSVLTFGQSGSDCKCDYYFSEVFLVDNEEGEKLLVCGIIKDTLSKDSIDITSISVYDCTNKELVLSYNYDEITPFTVVNNDDSIVFYNHHFAPVRDNWEMTSVPFEKWSVKFKDGIAIVSAGEIIFDYPELSENQTDSIKALCKTLSGYKEEEKILYPLDYETLYILFVGAYKDVENSRSLFEELRVNFTFDGAAAETLKEINYNTLINAD